MEIVHYIMKYLISILLVLAIVCQSNAQSTANTSSYFIVSTTTLDIIVPSDVEVIIKQIAGSRVIVDQSISAWTKPALLDFMVSKGRYALIPTALHAEGRTILRCSSNMPILTKDRKIITEKVTCVIYVPVTVALINIENL